MDPSNIMEVCRLCLDKERVTIPIFEGEGVDRDICLKIGSCLPVKVSSDDPLPKKICDECTSKVELVYSFWNTTANAEKQLLEWLGINEPHHRTPMDLLKTEMDDPGCMGDMDLGDESGEILLDDDDEEDDEDDDEGEGSEMESGREEDSGGGDYPYDDGNSNDHSSMDTSHNSAHGSVTEPGPSGIQAQQSGLSTMPPSNQPSVQEDKPVATEPDLTTPALIPLTAANIDASGNGPPVHAEQSTGRKGSHECSDCGKEFSSHSKMIQHSKVHKERTWECHLCFKKFLTEHHLKMHGAMHEEIRPHTCEKCGCSFRYLKTLETHRKIHANEEDNQRFLCLVCDMRFQTRNAYNHHTKSHKDSGRNNHGVLNCRFCGKTFSSRQLMVQHVHIHTGVKGFSCDVCGKELTSQESLHCHQLMHSGEKQLTCKICGRTFAHRKYYVVHQRIHTGERPYKCDICNKNFTQSSTLTVHRRYHTGERPYRCSVCSKGFVTKTLMLSHYKKHGESN